MLGAPFREGEEESGNAFDFEGEPISVGGDKVGGDATGKGVVDSKGGQRREGPLFLASCIAKTAASFASILLKSIYIIIITSKL